MYSKRDIGILGAIVAVAALNTVVAFENTDAKEPTLSRMYVSVGMDHFFEMRPGQTMAIPFNLTNTNAERASSVNLYVTEQGNEPFTGYPFLAPTNNGIDVRLSKPSSTIPASTGDVLQEDQMSVTVSIPEDAAPGFYNYTLIVQAANDSIEVRKYFYITVV